MDGSRAVINQNEGFSLGRIIMALALFAAFFSFVVLPGNVAAADGAFSDDTITIVLAIVVVTIVAIAALILLGSKKKKSSAAPVAKTEEVPAAKAEEPADEPGHNQDGKCSKCGAPMLESWDVCPKCAARILLAEITK